MTLEVFASNLVGENASSFHGTILEHVLWYRYHHSLRQNSVWQPRFAVQNWRNVAPCGN